MIKKKTESSNSNMVRCGISQPFVDSMKVLDVDRCSRRENRLRGAEALDIVTQTIMVTERNSLAMLVGEPER